MLLTTLKSSPHMHVLGLHDSWNNYLKPLIYYECRCRFSECIFHNINDKKVNWVKQNNKLYTTCNKITIVLWAGRPLFYDFCVFYFSSIEFCVFHFNQNQIDVRLTNLSSFKNRKSRMHIVEVSSLKLNSAYKDFFIRWSVWYFVEVISGVTSI